MDILITLLPVVPIGGLFFLWIAMIFHAVKTRIPNKLLWVILLILAGVIAAPFYYFAVYRKIAKKEDRQLFKRIVIAGGIIILVIAAATSFMYPSKDESSNLQEVSFSKVIDYNLKGEIKRIDLRGDELTITKKGEAKPSLRSRKPPGTTLQDHGIDPREVELIIH